MEFRPMSPEEMQRTVQFLLTQQAQFASDLASLNGQVVRIADAVLGLTGIVGRVAESQAQLVESHRGLVEAYARLVEAQERLAAAQARTDEQLRETDARLNIVIDMFERHLRENHGARPS